MLDLTSPLIQNAVHYSGHCVVPLLVAYLVFHRKYDWEHAGLIMVATILVDIDHIVATPFFDPTRCGIGYHPLHTLPAIALYFALTLDKNWKVKAVGLGLLIHMLYDLKDCYLGGVL